MKKMILDLDTGVDDALAISYALGSPEIELIGITGTYGNVLVEQGVRNALAVTDLLGHPEVKVYQGLPHSSTTDHFEVLPISAFIHGDNGIGDVEIPDSNRSVETESAVDFIIDLWQGSRLRADRPDDQHRSRTEEGSGNQRRNRPDRAHGWRTDRAR